MSVLERVFAVNGYKLQVKQWHSEKKTKIIALHGWLDNAASFDRLAPLLVDCHIVALDSPGHGLSEHKSAQASYNIWDDLLDILAIADELGWDKFIIMGHSRGAIMSLLLGAAAPERLEALILLDGIWPEAVEVQDTAKQLAAFLDTNRKAVHKRLPVYSTVEQAVEMRSQAASMSMDSARLIVERGLKAINGGYTWRTDPRLLAASAFKMTTQHNKALMNAITAPMLLLLAEQGLGANQHLLQKVENYSFVQYYLLPGSHHFHMEKEVDNIAVRINDFLQKVSLSEEFV